jgi:hypothetical protein
MRLHFKNNMSTTAVFLDIEKAFDTTWRPGLLYKLSKLQFSTSLISLLAHFIRKENSESQYHENENVQLPDTKNIRGLNWRG